LSIEDALEALQRDPVFARNVTAWRRLEARPARTADFPAGLDLRLRAALEARGWAPLYIHQAEAVAAALAGENVAVVTGTASGKTLCYNLPVLQSLLHEPQARALYLFPTKALAQDQAAALADLLGALDAQEAFPVRTYDGDTPQAERRRVREQARILITNPDMLHTGILPHHPRWAELLQNLRWVVVDELHVYRGIFGSNVANLFRRLQRITRFYGSQPRFLLTSATIANPKELAERLIEAPVRLVPVDLDGSPRAEKHWIVYNPPVIDPALGIRRAYTLEATRVAEKFLTAGVQTAVFAQSRRTSEILLGYVRDLLRERGGEPETVRGYRGGYLPLERREIERGLRGGEVRGVVATNALELGVDIGQLGAAVMAGYPGTLASVWQQSGRAGRRADTSAAVLVASANALDQFIALHPEFLFERSPETALINPDNLAILTRHLRCAAFELPFRAGELFGSYAETATLLDLLAENGELLHSAGAAETYRWVADAYPAADMSLRASGDDPVVIQDVGQGRPLVIGQVDRAGAPLLVHEGAVYTHEGATFLVQKLDWESGIAQVIPHEVDYYTEAGEAADLEILEVFDADEGRAARRAHGWALVSVQASSYRKVKRYTHETLGYGPIDLPPRQFETSAYWMWIAPEMVARLEAEGVLLPPNDYGPDWPSVRAAVRARDGNRCRQCNAPERPGRTHDVHHLRPFRQFGYLPGVNRYDRLANVLENLITLCAACHNRVETARGARSALGGLAYALGNIAPLFLMCDPRDLGHSVEVRSPQTHAPTITFYDQIAEGMGLAERLYQLHAELLAGAHELVEGCGCADGCPACVGPVGPDGVEVKRLTQRLIEALRAPPDERAVQ
jgi:DEAD/DEAH box helicase domain-containing protein